jgi:hypothetical protein
MARYRGGEKWRDDVCEAMGSPVCHLEQKWLPMVLGNSGVAPGLEVAGVELGLGLEGERLGEYVWEVAGDGVRSFAVSGGGGVL